MQQRRLLLMILLIAAPLLAQREAVLPQVAQPHSYYWREMYLPQLTTGPGSVAWARDSRSVVYSMGGGLWRQSLGSSVAEQLTDGPGYDYQPDVSPDQSRVVYAKYDGKSVELWLLELASRRAKQITKDEAVNVEPRWSPDGSRIAYVSTAYNGRFHIFVLHMQDGEPAHTNDAIQRLTGETRTDQPRYYYGPVDHEISPTWSPDGRELIFVSNRGHIYGTGGFWRMKAEPGAEPREIHSEETTWRARPDWSPDGKRLLYSSYQGRQWHQLWVTRPEGGDPIPISYGEYDNTSARWSPDGKRIAFISNRDGNTSLWIQEVLSGHQRQLVAKERKYRKPQGRLQINVLDAEGRPAAARVSVTGADGLAYAPDDAWMHADDGFTRSERNFEEHYFHTAGASELTVPAGRVRVEVMKGFEHRFEQHKAEITAGKTRRLVIRLRPLPPLPGGRWASGDLHVHMNYAGSYRNTPARMMAQGRAENLKVVHNLIVNKEQRVPDIAYFSGKPDAASTADRLLLHDQEFHTSYWGHQGLLGLTRNILLPDYAGYPGTAAASLYPPNAMVADMAREQGALVGYVHPFEIVEVPHPAEKAGKLTSALVLDVPLGRVDYLEVLGFSDHHATAGVWYRFLNLGFRIPAGAGTDAMANYASLHGPVGLNRVYVKVPPGPLRRESWLAGLKRGRTFATNGPLLHFKLGGLAPGNELELPAAAAGAAFTASLRSMVPVDKLEIVCNGRVVRDVEMNAARDYAEVRGKIPVTQSGWCLLRASSEKARHPILDIHPYATTSPVYVTVAGARPRSPEDAAYFLAWIARMQESVEKSTDWNTPDEREVVMKMIGDVRKIYEELK
ncbi:MAG: CehA/McbA family metallohydrolase [Acidobacteria bacterium]|nr:CehA/McbA family metallohydrolase [Acidobacteriota bacterium]